MICIQKIYGFHGKNHQNIEKSWYVTPVTDERTNGGGGRKWKIEQCSVGPETAKMGSLWMNLCNTAHNTIERRVVPHGGLVQVWICSLKVFRGHHNHNCWKDPMTCYTKMWSHYLTFLLKGFCATYKNCEVTFLRHLKAATTSYERTLLRFKKSHWHSA